jgi:hypothetical protein
MSERPFNTAPVDWKGEYAPFALHLTLPDGLLLIGSVVFIAISFAAVFIETPNPALFILLQGVHFQLSRYGLVIGVAMLVIAIYIGLIRKGDVTPWFRRGTYVIVGTMLVQALIGATMMFGLGVQPGAPEHLIYGLGTVLALPFFIFVETTARKRPAMGSYIWGFALLLGVIIRSIGTGPIG